jgi:hypothetical protein
MTTIGAAATSLAAEYSQAAHESSPEQKQQS